MSKILFVDSRNPGQTVSSPPNKKYSLTFYVHEGTTKYEEDDFYYLSSRVRFYVGRDAKYAKAFVKFKKENDKYAGAVVETNADTSKAFPDKQDYPISFGYGTKATELMSYKAEETEAADFESSLKSDSVVNEQPQTEDVDTTSVVTEISGSNSVSTDNLSYEFLKITQEEGDVSRLIKNADTFSVVNVVPGGGDHLKVENNANFTISIDDERCKVAYEINSEYNVAVYIKKQNVQYSTDSDIFVYASFDTENNKYYIQGYNSSDNYEFENHNSENTGAGE